MATDKLFTVCGTSKLNGETKVRFANDTLRLKVLVKHGHTNAILIELSKAMTKLAAVEFIRNLEEFAGASAQSAIADYLEANTPKSKIPSVKKTVKVTPQVEAIKGMTPLGVKENEDTPF